MKKYLTIFLLLLAAEVVIAFYHFHPIVRGFIGDVLVIPLLYTFIRIFLKISSEKLIISILLFAISVELLQLTPIYKSLGLNYKLLKIVMGNTFDPRDIIAYTLGAVLIVLTENYFGYKRRP